VTQAKLTLSGVDQTWIAYLLTLQYLGRTAVVYKAELDTSAAVIVDPVSILSGPMDAPDITEDPDTGEVLITVQVTSLGADLDAPNGFHSNLGEHQALFTGDMGFQYAAQLAGQSASRSVFWGSAPAGAGGTVAHCGPTCRTATTARSCSGCRRCRARR
jgi:hypothetical protein